MVPLSPLVSLTVELPVPLLRKRKKNINEIKIPRHTTHDQLTPFQFSVEEDKTCNLKITTGQNKIYCVPSYEMRVIKTYFENTTTEMFADP